MKVLHLKIASLVVLVVVFAGCSRAESIDDFCLEGERSEPRPTRCSYLDTPTSTVRSIKVESKKTLANTYPNATRMFANQMQAQSKTVQVLSHYFDVSAFTPNSSNDSLTRGVDNNQVGNPFQSIAEQMPDNPDMLYREQVLSNEDGTTETNSIYMVDEIQSIMVNLMDNNSELAPSYTHSLTLDFVEEIDDNKLLINGQYVVDPRTLDGAITVHLLNSYSKGESLTVVEKEIKQAILAIYPTATFEDLIQTNDLTRGFNTVCDDVSYLNFNSSVYKDCNKFWSGAVINYRWGPSLSESQDTIRVALTTAMTEWENATQHPTNGNNAITFNEISQAATLYKKYVVFNRDLCIILRKVFK